MNADALRPGSRAIFLPEIEQFGGAERSVLALCRWLYQRGLPVHIVTYADHCNLAAYATHPLLIVSLLAGPGPFQRITALRRYIRSRHPASPALLANGYQPALHTTLAGLRGFHTLMHDTPSLFDYEPAYATISALRRILSNRVVAHGLRSGGRTFVTSDYLRVECRKDFGIDAQIVRMGGLSTPTADEFRIRPVAPGGPLHLLSVCRIEANKRIDWLLHALAALERQAPALSSRVDWRLDLAGKGPLIPKLTALTASLGLADRVHFHGFVPDSQLEALYRQAHLFLMPAAQGYGIPAIESLQRGIPVLLHRQSGVSDLLLDTPWATVFTGSRETLTGPLASAIDGILSGRHHAAPLPYLPTEDDWAAQIALLCGWVAQPRFIEPTC